MESSHLIIIAVLLGSLAATVPVFMALFFTGLVGLVWLAGIDPQIVIEVLYRSIDKFALIVVLFFVLCGNIMTTGSIVQKLIRTANVLVGFLPGGLAMAGVLACGFFGAISGSTVATVVAIGGFMIPALIENKLRREVQRRHHDHRADPRHHHPAVDQHDSLCHGHQRFPGSAFSDRLHSGNPDHGGDVGLCLLLLQTPGAGNHAATHRREKRWRFCARVSGR